MSTLFQSVTLIIHIFINNKNNLLSHGTELNKDPLSSSIVVREKQAEQHHLFHFTNTKPLTFASCKSQDHEMAAFRNIYFLHYHSS